MATTTSLSWHRVLGADELPEGRVTTVTAGHLSIALTHVEGTYAALDNHCPHQGGPLGEGSIENGLLRCPWHGYDYCPLTGQSPGAYGDEVTTHPVELRDDGIYIGVPVEVEHVRTVSDVMVQTLVAWGVKHVFGMVGHSNLGLADAIRRAVQAGDMEYIGIRHEGAAAFAASAYGKLTGKPAACLTIAGPGATNLLTGMWDAKVDRAPVLALTGQVQTSVLGVHNFQEVDLRAAFDAVADWSQTVLPDSPHAELVSLACKHAVLRSGVSHLVFPDEVQTIPAAAGAKAGGPEGRVPDNEVNPPAAALTEAVARIAAAKRPVIIVGAGARFAMDDVVALAERAGAPVITTFKAKGQIADDHPLACGVLGRSGTPVASWVMNEADLLVVLGASFSNHTGIYRGHPIVQVDLDPLQLGKFHKVDVPVWGEVGVTSRAIAAALPAQPPEHRADQRPQVAERQAIWRAEKASRRLDNRGHGVASANVFDSLSRLTPEGMVIAVDVGNNTYSFGRYFECKPGQRVLMSGYLGSIGFGYPAAIGAHVATGEQVLAVTGDGGFGQYMGEILTAVKHDMNITHVLLNNGQLGKISKEQQAGSWDVWETSLHNPDFSEYARICGALGIRVTSAGELDEAIARALAHAGPALVEIVTDAELI
jgi:pyruvate oxidase